MADGTQITSPATAVATLSRSETPQNIVGSPTRSATPPIKNEKKDESANKDSKPPSQPLSSGASPAGTPTPAAPTPAPVKIESAESKPPADPATPAQKPLCISIPASTNGTALIPSVSAAAAPASGNPPAPFSTLAHIFSNTIDTPAISPLSDVGPTTKRSRTPEAEDEENSGEKRQKLEHVTDEPDQIMLDAEVQSEEHMGMTQWEIDATIQDLLDSGLIPADDDANGENGKNPPIPLPPPRPRLEKMKYIENPTYFARAMGLPTLGSLSVQILLALFQQPSEVTDRQIRDVRTEGGKVYTQLRQTFMALLKLFIDSPTFLSADDLDINEPGDRETIQMANLASMCASFYGPGGPTMATAHDNFLKIMIPENGIITQEIAALYLDQKTQSFLAYANVMEDKEATRNSLMDKFFPVDLEDKLRVYWKESNLAEYIPAEDFVEPFTERRTLLKTVGHDKEQRKALESKYQFASFLDSLSAFIRSNFDSILDYAEAHGVEVPNEAGEEDLMLMHAQSTYAGSYPGQPRRNGEPDTEGLALLISEKFAGEEGYSFGYGIASAIPESKILPPSQSLPTSVLYERARQAAVAKSSAGSRREGLQSTRRPWTPEEEKALMAGLDMVKGPHWSQILQLFGPSGTIKDILKDRTQVQLKDKARNLKLFFLKTNSEMPYYLQAVTGELKTRAPSQAAKKEAEEEARVRAGGPANGYAYMNGPANGNGAVAHSMPIATSPRPGTTPPVAGPNTPAGVNSSHPPPHQQYHPPQQSYQQQRPQQLQPAPNGATRSPAPAGHHPPSSTPKPLAPHSSHQPIAPAPSYQRPLQQAGAPQYQQRPLQQATGHPPASHQQNRPVAPQPSNGVPQRGTYASTTPQIQSRSPAPVGQGPPRPIQNANAAPPRPGSIPAAGTAQLPRPTSIPAAKLTPLPASGQAPRGVPTNNVPVQRVQTTASTSGAAATPRPVQQPNAPMTGQQGPPRPAQQPLPPTGSAPVPARPIQESPAPNAAAPAPSKPIQQQQAPLTSTTPAPTRPIQQQPAPPPHLTQQPAVVNQPPAAPTPPPSTAPASAPPPLKSATPAPASTAAPNGTDKVEANIEMLAQTMRDENA